MHPLTTLERLNREAEEAAHILNAHSPAAPKPVVEHAEPADFIAKANATKDRILNGAKG